MVNVVCAYVCMKVVCVFLCIGVWAGVREFVYMSACVYVCFMCQSVSSLGCFESVYVWGVLHKVLALGMCW